MKHEALQRYKQSVIDKARELYIAGRGVTEISQNLKEEYDVVVPLSTMANWAKRYGWKDARDQAATQAITKYADTREGELTAIIEGQLSAYKLLRTKGKISFEKLKNLTPRDALTAIDIGSEGERKVLAGILSLKFLQEIAQIIMEEIKDEDVLRRIATRFRELSANFTA